MGDSESFFSESLLLAACKLSCSVYISGRDDPSYLRTDIGNTAVFAFRGSLDPHLFTCTANKYGECQIKNVGCLECMKDGNNHPASVHQGALNQFLYVSNNSSVQKENCRARLSLRAAGQVLKQQRANESKVDNEVKLKIKNTINNLEKYRSQCFTSGIGYYDAFKLKQRRELDFKANLQRLELAGCWDKIKQMIWVAQNSVDKFVYKNELPDDFQCREEWIRLGTLYRLLVEPLDIANYYRLGYNEDSTGHYLVHGRPLRYKILQKWLEDNEENKQLIPRTTGDQPTMFTQDSCFWAYVEEISCLMRNNNLRDDNKSNVLVKSKCQEFEERVGRLIDSDGLCMEELLTGESTFKRVVKWLWKHKTPLQKESSPFRTIMDRYPELIG